MVTCGLFVIYIHLSNKIESKPNYINQLDTWITYKHAARHTPMHAFMLFLNSSVLH